MAMIVKDQTGCFSDDFLVSEGVWYPSNMHGKITVQRGSTLVTLRVPGEEPYSVGLRFKPNVSVCWLRDDLLALYDGLCFCRGTKGAAKLARDVRASWRERGWLL